MKNYKKIINKILQKNKKFVNEYSSIRVRKLISASRIEAFGNKRSCQNFSYFRKVRIGNNSFGFISNIGADSIKIEVYLGSEFVKLNDSITLISKFGPSFSFFSANEFVLNGCVLNPIGLIIYNPNNIDKTVQKNIFLPIFLRSPPLAARKPVSRSLVTGIKVLDIIIPIGKGQRQLLLGDRRTGKTQMCLDILQAQNVNCQKTSNFFESNFSIFISIGKRVREVKEIADFLSKKSGNLRFCIITASASETRSLQYLAPWIGVSFAYAMQKFANFRIFYKKDVVIFIDDLRQHAFAFREISLMQRRSPGRDAYPADMFYQHSRLLELGGNFYSNEYLWEYSITCLPIVETIDGDIAGYISTNVISITDGQVYFSRELSLDSIFPRVDIGLSVSRVGSAVQSKDMRSLAGPLKLKLSQFFDLKEFAQYASDLDYQSQQNLLRGQKLTAMLQQQPNNPCSVNFQLQILRKNLNES